jgi:poly(3-hydroxybutyrate) depolymerase
MSIKMITWLVCGTVVALASTRGAEPPVAAPIAPVAISLDGQLEAAAVAKLMEAPQWCAIKGHPLRFLLSLPKGWRADQKWPVVVAVTGSNGNFPTLANGYHGVHETMPFIVIVPATVSSTSPEKITTSRFPHYTEAECQHWAEASDLDKLRYDMDGLQQILAAVRAHLGGEEKIHLSGFSKGGTLAWQMAFLHGDQLHMMFPVCAVYKEQAQAAVPIDRPLTNPSLPIYAFQGKNDGYLDGLNESWERASAFACQQGFTNVTRTVTWRKHDWHHEEILYMCYGHVMGRRAERSRDR